MAGWEKLGNGWKEVDIRDGEEGMARIRASHEGDLKMEIGASELAEWMKLGNGLKVVDIRTREEHAAARIEGAVLFSQELMQEMLGRWKLEEPVVIVDHQG